MRRNLSGLVGFPDPVNEHAARTVAAGVVLTVAATLALDLRWLVVPLAYGFWARVLTGPRLSPLGQVATRVIAPRLPWPARHTPGAPKRFAQGIGTFVSTAALVTWTAGEWTVSVALLAVLGVAALAEAAAGLCVGCRLFALLMRWGVVPETACEACGDLRTRHSQLWAGAGSQPDATG